MASSYVVLKSVALAVAVLPLFGMAVRAASPTSTGLPFPGPQPGRAAAASDPDQVSLSNNALEVSWTLEAGTIVPALLTDRLNDATLSLNGELFALRTADDRTIKASDLRLLAPPAITRLDANPTSPRVSERCGGRQIVARLSDGASNLEIEWRAQLRDGSNYIRQTVTLHATRTALSIKELVLLDLAVPAGSVMGTVDGSPIVAGNVFLGYEHPMARNTTGYPSSEVGTWSPSQVSYPQRMEITWNVTPAIKQEGTHEVLFDYTTGAHRLEIFRVALLEDGRQVAQDEHFGATGTVDNDNTYRLVLPSRVPGAEYTLTAQVRSDGGTDSHGIVTIASHAGERRARGAFTINRVLEAGESLTQSSVLGVVPQNQLRRGFLHYVERERAHPYRTFLHYNSWYDIGYFSKFDESDCLSVIHAYGQELARKRGVVLDSFLFDDGWDDHGSLWSFHQGLPNGFAPIRDAAAAYKSSPGVWLSPWGGYGEPRKQRLKFGEAAGFETNREGFALSAPRYFQRFRDICLTMIREYGVNQFKFDGVGRAGGRFPGSRFGSDFEAAIQLIRDLRQARPDVYINLTTGTWPSPFWLIHADSIWRGGHDHEFTGVGTDRQQWMTYRDAQTYQNVVRRGPLFPLSSLMLHGVICAKHARRLDTDPGNDLRDEIRTAFGCGTQSQELYVTPGLLTEQNWDDLAAAAAWARRNADPLRDTHWIGGDPAKLEVYGWASWSPTKGILVLRNPSDKPQSYTVDIAQAFELPPDAPHAYALESPYPDQRLNALHLAAGRPRRIELQPFEVLVFDAMASK